jgi:hypothetical protein
MKFTPKWFYVKSTSKYKYVGQTTQDVLVYQGSGVKWKRHLQKTEQAPNTEVAVWCETADQFLECLATYVPVDYVSNPEWANSIEESPFDISPFQAGRGRPWNQTQEARDRVKAQMLTQSSEDKERRTAGLRLMQSDKRYAVWADSQSQQKAAQGRTLFYSTEQGKQSQSARGSLAKGVPKSKCFVPSLNKVMAVGQVKRYYKELIEEIIWI